MAAFKHKPIIIEAWQWLGQPEVEWPDWLKAMGPESVPLTKALLRLPVEDSHVSEWVSTGKWLIAQPGDRPLVMSHDEFVSKYDPINSTDSRD